MPPGRLFSLTLMTLAVAGFIRADGMTGSTHQEVLDYYGKPTNLLRSGAKEVLIYPEGRVVLMNGKVVQMSMPYPLASDPLLQQPTATAGSLGVKGSGSAGEHMKKAAALAKKTPAEPGSPSAAAAMKFQIPLLILGAVSVVGLVVAVILKFRRQAGPKQKKGWRPSPWEPEPVVPISLPNAAASSPDLPAPRLVRAPVLDRDMTPPAFPLSTPLVPGVPPAPAPATLAPLRRSPTRLTLELLLELEWRRFEEVAAGFYRVTGTRPELTRAGANGGLDLRLYRAGDNRPYCFVQCKAWVDRDIDHPILVNTVAIMAADGIGQGVVITPRAFTPEARRYAESKPLELLDGPGFLRLFNLLSPAEQEGILREATRGDYRTPTCPRCGQKMVQRAGEGGREWYCTGFPQCHAKPLKVRGDDPPAPARPTARLA